MKNTHCITVVLIVFLLPTFINGQSSSWNYNIGGPGMDAANDMCSDYNGAIYITGSFQDEILVNNTTYLASGSSDIFLAKINKNGSCEWFYQAGGPSIEPLVINEYGQSVACFEKYIYYTGVYDQKAKFADTTMISKGGNDVFLEKLTLSGKREWILNIGGVGNDYIEKLVLDNKGNVYLTGILLGESSIGSYYVNNKSCIRFIAKLNSAGEVLWVNQLSGKILGKDIGVDSDGNVILICSYSNNISVGKYDMQSTGEQDICIIKYANNGKLLWSKSFNGIGVDEISSSISDDDDNIYLAGNFNNAIRFDKTELFSNGMQDAFIVKLEPDGNVLWARSLGGLENDRGTKLVFDNQDNIMMGGMFAGSVYSINDTLITNKYPDIFFASYSNDGTLISSTSIGGPYIDILSDFICDMNGEIYMLIKYNNEFYSDNNIHYSQGYEDIFIGKTAINVESFNIEENASQSDAIIHFEVVPNPSKKGSTAIVCNKAINARQIHIVTLNGQKLRADHNVSFPYKVHTQNLENGLYFVKIYLENELYIEKIIIAN
jgi:hypothetical protein